MPTTSSPLKARAAPSFMTNAPVVPTKRRGKYVLLNERLEVPTSGVRWVIADRQQVSRAGFEGKFACARGTSAGGLTRTGSRVQLLNVQRESVKRMTLECGPGAEGGFLVEEGMRGKGDDALPKRECEGMLYLLSLPKNRSRIKE